jgi:hypothetical protein
MGNQTGEKENSSLDFAQPYSDSEQGFLWPCPKMNW